MHFGTVLRKISLKSFVVFWKGVDVPSVHALLLSIVTPVFTNVNSHFAVSAICNLHTGKYELLRTALCARCAYQENVCRVSTKCGHDTVTIQQTFSKCIQNRRELLDVCYTFAGSCKHPITLTAQCAVFFKWRLSYRGITSSMKTSGL